MGHVDWLCCPMLRGYWDSTLNTCRRLEYVWLTCGKVARLCKSLCNLHQWTWMTSSIPLPSAVCQLCAALNSMYIYAVNTCISEQQYTFIKKKSNSCKVKHEKMQFCHAMIYQTSCNCSVRLRHTPFIHNSFFRERKHMIPVGQCVKKIQLATKLLYR